MVSGSSEPPAWDAGYRYLTPEVPPVALRYRACPEDFVVHEIPKFPPSGEGQHLMIEVEKRGIATRVLVRRLSQALGVGQAQIGFAGRKDAHAVTRQWLTVYGGDEERARGLELRDARVLHVERHERKLRVGQLRANRFRLTLREIADEDRPHVETVVERVRAAGLPNYYGEQRFGRTGRTAELGRLLIEGDREAYVRALLAPRHAGEGEPEAELRALSERGGGRGALQALAPRLDGDLRAVALQLARRPGDLASAARAVPKPTRRFHVNALQSSVFNQVVGARLGWPAGLAALVPGDLACFHDGRGSIFRVSAPGEEEAARAARFELSPTGPMVGARVEMAEGPPGEVEEAALDAHGLAREDFQGLKDGMGAPGARRALRVRVEELALSWEGDAAVLEFCLPPGAYATTLIEELSKGRAVMGRPDPEHEG